MTERTRRLLPPFRTHPSDGSCWGRKGGRGQWMGVGANSPPPAWGGWILHVAVQAVRPGRSNAAPYRSNARSSSVRSQPSLPSAGPWLTPLHPPPYSAINSACISKWPGKHPRASWEFLLFSLSYPMWSNQNQRVWNFFPPSSSYIIFLGGFYY